MKQFKLFLLLTAFCGSLALSACSNDDDENNNGGGSTGNSMLVGTWRHDFSTGYQLITFKSNGTGVMQEYDAADGGWYDPDSFNYSHNLTKNTVFLYFEDGERVTYQITQLTNSSMSWYNVDWPSDAASWYRQNN